MAIIIPSKNIYGTPKSNIIRKNIVDKIEVDLTKIELVNTTGNIYNVTANETFSNESNQNGTVAVTEGTVIQQYRYWYASCAYTAILQPQYITTSIVIPKQQGNKIIKKLYYGTNDNGNANISYSVYGTIRSGTASGTTTLTTSHNLGEHAVATIPQISSVDVTKIENDVYIPVSSGETKISYSYSYTMPGGTDLVAETEQILNSSANVFDVIPTEHENDYTVTLKLLCGYTLVELGGGHNKLQGGDNDTMTVPLNGTYLAYTAQRVEISFAGETFGIEIGNEIRPIGNGTNVFAFDNNELIQTTNTPLDSKYEEVLEHYKDGKETAVIRCSISEYKDENRIVKIDPNTSTKMMFAIGDEVIPMVYTANGIDRPMSIYKDGSKKVFRVVGVNPYYDGAVWQELTIQEK